MARKASCLYTSKKLRLPASPLLDALALAAGDLYSKTVTTYWRILRKKDIFLSQFAMEKLHTSPKLHAHTSDAIVGNFYSAVKSANSLKKNGAKEVKYPKKHRKFYKITWKSSTIRIKNGNLILPNGKGNDRLSIPWNFPLPLQVEIGWRKAGGYELRATYGVVLQPCLGTKVASVDLGEIRSAAVFDGDKVTVYSGRLVRSKQRYLNKVKAELSSKIDTAKKGTNRHKKLIKTKQRICNNLNNQIKDILHKQSSHIVSVLHQRGTQTVVIGDVRDIRENKNEGKYRNQQFHQALYGKMRWNITYKAARKGIGTVLQEESYTSKTCPRCSKHNEPNRRMYKCSCGFEYDRDGVGAINILAKYRGNFGTPVVGGMAPPVVGVKFIPHLQCRLSPQDSRTPWRGVSIIASAQNSILQSPFLAQLDPP